MSTKGHCVGGGRGGGVGDTAQEEEEEEEEEEKEVEEGIYVFYVTNCETWVEQIFFPITLSCWVSDLFN